MEERVAVVGASAKSWRYSNRAIRMLLDHGHTPVPVSASGHPVENLPGYRSLRDVPGVVDTVTMYVGAPRQAPIVPDILAARPRRVIFNPGAENPESYPRLEERGIQVLEACTLVLLSTGQF